MIFEIMAFILAVVCGIAGCVILKQQDTIDRLADICVRLIMTGPDGQVPDRVEIIEE